MELKTHIMDEKTGVQYTLCGDYYLPSFALQDEAAISENRPLGRFGIAYHRFIKEHRRALYNELWLSGKLEDHIREVDDQASKEFNTVSKQMAESEGVNEKLKAEDQMKWVRRMNSIRNRADEIILSDLLN